MMKLEAFQKLLMAFAAQWPHSKFDVENPVTLGLWFDEFKTVDEAVLRTAFRRIMRSQDFFPTFAVVVRMVDEVLGEAAVRADTTPQDLALLPEATEPRKLLTVAEAGALPETPWPENFPSWELACAEIRFDAEPLVATNAIRAEEAARKRIRDAEVKKGIKAIRARRYAYRPTEQMIADGAPKTVHYKYMVWFRANYEAFRAAFRPEQERAALRQDPDDLNF